MIRTTRFGLSLIALLALLGVACSDDGPTRATVTATATGAPTEAATSAASFPVTIAHQYGSTTIPAEPQRVVSFGYNEQDSILALGVKPVAIRDWWADQPFATWPWAQGALGDAEPTIFVESDIELIASLAPDLIIAVYYGMTPEEYELLSQIAPTIPRPGNYIDYGVPWEEQLAVIGQALGKPDDAASLIEGVEAKFAEVRAAHPEWEGMTAIVGGAGGDGGYSAYAADDSRNRFIRNLGFVVPEDFAALAGDQFYVPLSAEHAQLLDVDVLLWLNEESEMEDDAIFHQLAAVQEGRVIYIDLMQYGALSFSSPLSLPFAIEEFIPLLEAATAKLP